MTPAPLKPRRRLARKHHGFTRSAYAARRSLGGSRQRHRQPGGLPAGLRDRSAACRDLAQIPGYIDVLDNFYIGHYGSIEAAAQQSLGTQLAAQGIETPIYLRLFCKDTFTTNGITAPLVQALQARQPAARARVWTSGERGRVGRWRGPGFV